MYTFNLNRPLFSFGLGVWLVVVEVPGGSAPYIARGSTDYIARELSRLYPAHSITFYIASGIVVVTREFAVTENTSYISSFDTTYWEAHESSTYMIATPDRIYEVIESTNYLATETSRTFTARGETNYAGFYIN